MELSDILAEIQRNGGIKVEFANGEMKLSVTLTQQLLQQIITSGLAQYLTR